MQSGAYRALPSWRVNIPKAHGGTRPLGIAAIEDKIVQKAVAEWILTPIYEAEFLGFSRRFVPGRGAHDELDVLAYGITKRKVNWVVDADIRAFFDRKYRPSYEVIGLFHQNMAIFLISAKFWFPRFQQGFIFLN